MKKKLKLLIQIRYPLVKLFLHRRDKKIDSLGLKEENNLSEILLVKIDEILRRNNFSKKDLEKIEVESDRSSYSSSRIASVTAKVSNFYLTNFEN